MGACEEPRLGQPRGGLLHRTLVGVVSKLEALLALDVFQTLLHLRPTQTHLQCLLVGRFIVALAFFVAHFSAAEANWRLLL